MSLPPPCESGFERAKGTGYRVQGVGFKAAVNHGCCPLNWLTPDTLPVLRGKLYPARFLG